MYLGPQPIKRRESNSEKYGGTKPAKRLDSAVYEQDSSDEESPPTVHREASAEGMADVVQLVASGLLKDLGDLPDDAKEALGGLQHLDQDLVRKVLSARGPKGEPIISSSAIRHVEDAFKYNDPIEAAVHVYRLYHSMPEDLRWDVKRRLPPLVRLAFEVNDDIDLSADSVEQLIMCALELDIRGAAEIYDTIPRANKQRVLSRLPAKIRRHARLVLEMIDGISPEQKAKLAFSLLPPAVKATRQRILEEKIIENGGQVPPPKPKKDQLEAKGAAAAGGDSGPDTDTVGVYSDSKGSSTKNPLQGASAPRAPGADGADAMGMGMGMGAGAGEFASALQMAAKLRTAHRSFKEKKGGGAASGSYGAAGGGAAAGAAAAAAAADSPTQPLVASTPPPRRDAAMAAKAVRDLEDLREVEPKSMEEAQMEIATSSVSAAVWGQMRELGGWVAEGPCGIRVLSFLFGVCAILSAFIGIFINFADAKKTKGRTIVFVVLNGWIMWFGILIAITEARTAFCGMFLRRAVEKYMPIFTTVSGRGHLMFLVGSLCLAQWSASQILNIVVGLGLMVLAVANWVTSCCAMYHFVQLKSSVATEAEAAEAFDAADLDGSGDLDTTELADLCVQLGSKLSHAELEAAIMEMDKNRDRMISKAEFLAWWSGDLRSGGGWMSAMQAIATGEDIPEEGGGQKEGGGSGSGGSSRGSGGVDSSSMAMDFKEAFSVDALAAQLKRSDEARIKGKAWREKRAGAQQQKQQQARRERVEKASGEGGAASENGASP